MTYFMTEIRASDWQRSVLWYQSVLGLRVVLADLAHQFALLEVGQGGGRVAIKGAGPPAGQNRDAVRLVFEVEDLETQIDGLTRQAIPFTGPRLSDEGYRDLLLSDPDGTPVTLFAWVERPAAAMEEPK